MISIPLLADTTDYTKLKTKDGFSTNVKLTQELATVNNYDILFGENNGTLDSFEFKAIYSGKETISDWLFVRSISDGPCEPPCGIYNDIDCITGTCIIKDIDNFNISASSGYAKLYGHNGFLPLANSTDCSFAGCDTLIVPEGVNGEYVQATASSQNFSYTLPSLWASSIEGSCMDTLTNPEDGSFVNYPGAVYSNYGSQSFTIQYDNSIKTFTVDLTLNGYWNLTNIVINDFVDNLIGTDREGYFDLVNSCPNTVPSGQTSYLALGLWQMVVLIPKYTDANTYFNSVLADIKSQIELQLQADPDSYTWNVYYNNVLQ